MPATLGAKQGPVRPPKAVSSLRPPEDPASYQRRTLDAGDGDTLAG